MKKKIGFVVFAVLYTAACALLANAFADTQSEWYLSLEKSPLTPPGAVFGIAWGVWYLLLAVSFSLVLIASQGRHGILFLLNGILLAVWCLLFFRLALPLPALIVLVGTFLSAYFLTNNAFRDHRLAGILLIPYDLWLGFAIYLNYYIVLMN